LIYHQDIFIQNIIDNKDINIDSWKQKYKDVKLGWDWDEIDTWIETIQDKAKKKRLLPTFITPLTLNEYNKELIYKLGGDHLFYKSK